MAKELDPLEQFEVHVVAPLAEGAAINLSLTNIAVFSLVTSGVILAFVFAATRRLTMVPNRMQSLGEVTYQFIAKMITDVIGPDGLRFVPFVFSLFTFVLVANLLGMIPLFPTVTAQLAITLTLGLLSILTVVIFGLIHQGLGFFRLFAPSGLPIWLYPIIVPIEVVSFVARPFTLGVRLFANMLAGHLIIKLFAGFAVMMGSLGAVGLVGALLPLFGIFAVTGLEFLVAFLQAYVFAILTVIYLNDAVHGHH